MSDKQEKLHQLARDVLNLSRNTLLVNLRFLDSALSQFELFPIESDTLLTDGKYILYNPTHILQCYKAGKEFPVRDYLHMVMHCVFRHMYMDPSLNRPYWDLACDIAVENVITELGLKAVTTARERQQTQYIAAIKKELKHVTAEKIYSWLRQSLPDEKRIAEIRGTFYADNHEIWYMTAAEIELRFGLAASAGNSDVESCSAMAQVWQTISERMQVDAETFGKKRGNVPGGLLQNLKEVTREKYDYTSFPHKRDKCLAQSDK